MPVRIRLALHGCTNRPFYHIVVAPSKFKRDGRHLEQVGSYDPMPNNKGEKLVAINMERIKYWLLVGAQPTTPVAKLLGLAGMLPKIPRLYLESERRQKTLESRHNPHTEQDVDGMYENSIVTSTDQQDHSHATEDNDTPV